VLQATGIHKTYGGIVALRGVDLRVRAGSVHALLGENGAGKSTLVKILGGATRPDEGTVLLDGTEVSFATTVEGVAEGVAVVSQELNLFPDLDVLANLFPMREPKRGPLVDRATMARLARPVLDDLGLRAPLTTLVRACSSSTSRPPPSRRAGRSGCSRSSTWCGSARSRSSS
jgi:ABC-type sugar transport system ATPase subunit